MRELTFALLDLELSVTLLAVFLLSRVAATGLLLSLLPLLLLFDLNSPKSRLLLTLLLSAFRLLNERFGFAL